MAGKTEKLRQLRQQVSESAKQKSSALVGEQMAESGLLDHGVLNREIQCLLDGLEKDQLGSEIGHHVEAFLESIQQGDVPGAADHTSALLKLELDDLRKAALLSLLVRLAGKRKFDPVAAYVLENRATYVTNQA